MEKVTMYRADSGRLYAVEEKAHLDDLVEQIVDLTGGYADEREHMRVSMLKLIDLGWTIQPPKGGPK